MDHEPIGEQDIGARRLRAPHPGFHLPSGHEGSGVGGNVPRRRHARRGERNASARAREGSGKRTNRRNRRRSFGNWRRSRRNSTVAVGREEGLACRPDRSGRRRGRRGSCEKGRPRCERVPLSPGDGRLAGADRWASVRPLEPTRTGSATTSARDTGRRRRSC